MDEQREYNNRLFLSVAVCAIITIILSKMPLGSLLFNLPLLLIAPRIKKRFHAVLVFVVTGILVIAVNLFDFRELLNSETIGLLFFVLFYQIVSSVGSTVWVALRDYSDSVLRKLVICSYAIAALGIPLGIFLSTPVAAKSVEAIVQTLVEVIDFTSLGISADVFADIFVSTLVLIIVPLGMTFSSIQIIVSELVIHKRDEDWQRNFAAMKMPNSFIWVFMASWLLVIVSSIVVLPTSLVIIVWNIALGLSLHYYMGGLSVLIARVQRRTSELQSSRIIVPVMILSIIPGINIAVIAGLTLIGALETWINMR